MGKLPYLVSAGNAIQREENKTGLPDNLKSGMESLSGMSLDHVKVHYNSSKPASVQAHAFAQGSDIHIASGQEKHLPHELGHVVQQAQGMVKPTTSIGGVAVNDSPTLESEATKMGERALQMKSKDIIQKFENKSIKNGNNLQLSFKNTSKIIQKKIITKDVDIKTLAKNIKEMGGSQLITLLDKLEQSEAEIFIFLRNSKSSYIEGKHILVFEKDIIDNLIKGDVDDATKVSHIATITHELSHAYDEVIKGKNLTDKNDDNENMRKIIETELRAWANEASVAFQVGEKLGAMDEEKEKLIDGWKNYKPSMLNKVSEHRKTNHIVARLYQYIVKNMRFFDSSEVQNWLDTDNGINKKFINNIALNLKNNSYDNEEKSDKIDDNIYQKEFKSYVFKDYPPMIVEMENFNTLLKNKNDEIDNDLLKSSEKHEKKLGEYYKKQLSLKEYYEDQKFLLKIDDSLKLFKYNQKLLENAKQTQMFLEWKSYNQKVLNNTWESNLNFVNLTSKVFNFAKRFIKK